MVNNRYNYNPKLGFNVIRSFYRRRIFVASCVFSSVDSNKDYMYYLQHSRPCCIGHTNSRRNGLKNSSSYEPTGEKSLEIDEVYAEKIKVKV